MSEHNHSHDDHLHHAMAETPTQAAPDAHEQHAPAMDHAARNHALAATEPQAAHADHTGDQGGQMNPSAHDSHGGHGGHGTHAEHGGHGEHAGHSEAMFRRPFWVALVLTIPILIYAELLQDLLGYQAPAFPGSAWLAPVLGSIIYWYGGWVFLTGAVAELRAARPGMMTLVALAITTRTATASPSRRPGRRDAL